MIRSMTGYGKAAGMIRSRQITVEIKSLNSKQLDISLKIPSFYNEYEPEIRNAIAQHLERGKVYCNVQVDNTGDDTETTINLQTATSYYSQMKALEKELKLGSSPDYLSILMRMPDILKTPQPEPDNEEHNTLTGILLKAIKIVDLFREQEGRIMAEDILKRINRIHDRLLAVEPYENERITRLKGRITRELNEGMENGVDRNRFEQEMIYYLEKLDITEEKIRLANHLDYFAGVMKDGSAANGRKLGFIAQEIGREINTLGAKANDSDIQKLVVEMKDELEKIKEQLLNIL